MADLAKSLKHTVEEGEREGEVGWEMVKMVRKQKTGQLKGMSEGQLNLSNHFKFFIETISYSTVLRDTKYGKADFKTVNIQIIKFITLSPKIITVEIA